MTWCGRSPVPGTTRLTVVILAVVAGGYGYPWQSVVDRWVLGVAVGVILLALVWWHGRHVTTILAQRLRIALVRKPISTPDDPTTVVVLLRVEDGEPPVDLLRGYLDRYGLRCDSIRITTRSTPNQHTAWIGLRFSAARNLAALQARSPQLPLNHTARNAGRRLIQQLAEKGITAKLVDPEEIPDMLAGDARERWRFVTDGRGFLTAYADSTTASMADRSETWVVVEISGTPTESTTRSAMAIRTENAPTPIPGAVPLTGRQAAALAAIHPLSDRRLLN